MFFCCDPTGTASLISLASRNKDHVTPTGLGNPRFSNVRKLTAFLHGKLPFPDPFPPVASPTKMALTFLSELIFVVVTPRGIEPRLTA